MQMGFFSFLKYTFIIFAAHLATSCVASFENHWVILSWIGSEGSVYENGVLYAVEKGCGGGDAL
jgi:hypothetical protein